MRVIDLIHSNEKTAFSFEILPPLKGTGIEKLYQTRDCKAFTIPIYLKRVTLAFLSKRTSISISLRTAVNMYTEIWGMGFISAIGYEDVREP
jgi:hypothetical protein